MKTTRLLLVLVSLLAASFVPAGSNQVFHDPETDFFTYKTYHWAESDPAHVPELRQYLERKVDERLKAAGLERVESGGDLAIEVYVSGGTSAANVGGYYNHVTYEIAIITTRINVTTEAALSIDLVDTFRNRAVWHGHTEVQVNAPSHQKMRKKIDKVVKKLFRDYPPITGL